MKSSQKRATSPDPPPENRSHVFSIQEITINDPYLWIRQNLRKNPPSKKLASFIATEQQYFNNVTADVSPDLIDILAGRMDALPARKNHPAPPSLPQPVTKTPAKLPHKIPVAKLDSTNESSIESVDYKVFEKFEDISPIDDPDDIRRLPVNYGDYFFRGRGNKLLIYSLEDVHGHEKWQIIVHDDVTKTRTIIPRASQNFAVDAGGNVYFTRQNEIGRYQFFCVWMKKTGEITVLLDEELDPTIELRIELSTDENFAFIYRERTQTSQVIGIDLRHSAESLSSIRDHEMKILTNYESGVSYHLDFSDGYIYSSSANNSDTLCITR
jgi:protease II